MKNLQNLNHHYSLLLGLVHPWTVANVDLQIAKKLVEVEVVWPNEFMAICPDCGKSCALKDHREERRWRHLDTMQFETVIKARVPRSLCPKHGVKTVNTPWADPGSRFTLLFEGLAIDVILASKSLKDAAELLGLSWDQIHLIQKRSVERGLKRRSLENIRNVGIDEKSFLKDHKYASLMVDIDGERVIDVVQDRTIEATDQLWAKLPKDVRDGVEAVATDMWDSFITSTKNNAPNAEIVHDKFHISKYLNDAVDKVRKSEHKDLKQKGDESLTGKKYLFLTRPENLSPERLAEFNEIRKNIVKTSRAWSIKEMFSDFWNYTYEAWACKFFDKWYWWATHSKLEPVIKVAKMLKRHFPNIITYLKHRITNALIEGFNSKIQSIKSNARGYKNFENYRVAILFNCGKLSLYPQ